MKPNWFVGLPCPVAKWYEAHFSVHPPPPRVRVFAADDLHMTIAFLGPVSEANARAAFAVVDQQSRSGFEITLSHVEPMGPKRRFSALSVIPGQGRDAVEALMREYRDAMRLAAGLAAESRDVLAHMTVARPQRKASTSERQVALDWAQEIDFAGCVVRLSEVALYTWADDRSERLFKIVDRRAI